MPPKHPEALHNFYPKANPPKTPTNRPRNPNPLQSTATSSRNLDASSVWSRPRAWSRPSAWNRPSAWSRPSLCPRLRRLPVSPRPLGSEMFRAFTGLGIWIEVVGLRAVGLDFKIFELKVVGRGLGCQSFRVYILELEGFSVSSCDYTCWKLCDQEDRRSSASNPLLLGHSSKKSWRGASK